MKMQLSLGQIDLRIGATEANFQKVHDMTQEASRLGSSLVVFPELWSTAYALEEWRQLACVLNSGMFERISALARANKIAIAGSILEMDGDRAFNTMTLHGQDGELIGSYRKVHLVPMLDEPRWLAAGNTLSLVETAWGNTGLGICYDLRFPEMWRSYALRGAKIFIIPAEWPSQRATHWKTLLRARAIENQAFMVACNRVGETKGVHFAGHSAVIDPWGEALVEAGSDAESLLTTELDFSKVDEIRANIPVFSSRRPELY